MTKSRTDARKHDRDLELLIDEVGQREPATKNALHAGTLARLVFAAERSGIRRLAALKVIESDPGDCKAGAIKLIEKIKGRSTKGSNRTSA